MKILNVGPYQVCEPITEGVRVIMNHLGEPYSSVYLQGISGVAFRIAGICPCAPTCSEVAPILVKCANAYEQAIGCLELALPLL